MDREAMLNRAWDRNAARWTRTVRDGLIPSRRAGTDEAVVAAIAARNPRRLLDVGCGEGWLVRRLCRDVDCTALGIDGSASLIEDARAADPNNSDEVVSYADLIGGQTGLAGGFDVAVFNYALFDEQVDRGLAAAAALLARGGVIVVQTLHPWALSQTETYGDGWRIEDFSAFDGEEWEPMPWFFRTLESWHATIRAAGLTVVDLVEPKSPVDSRPLSLIMVCKAVTD